MEADLEVHRSIPITEECHVGQLRRALHDLARQIGASEEVKARAALVATELSTNLLKHPGSGGVMLYRSAPRAEGQEPSIELLSLDSGKGIPNISQALQDGFSTAGSPGTGMGAVQRMSDSMEIFSSTARGTVICVEIISRLKGAKSKTSAIRSVCTPLEGYEISGDHWAVQHAGGKLRIMLADGLGHGPEAAAA
jgi:anti-sigma regulatory factor (Ser/Thr protein kinase)